MEQGVLNPARQTNGPQSNREGGLWAIQCRERAWGHRVRGLENDRDAAGSGFLHGDGGTGDPFRPIDPLRSGA